MQCAVRACVRVSLLLQCDATLDSPHGRGADLGLLVVSGRQKHFPLPFMFYILRERVFYKKATPSTPLELIFAFFYGMVSIFL